MKENLASIQLLRVYDFWRVFLPHLLSDVIVNRVTSAFVISLLDFPGCIRWFNVEAVLYIGNYPLRADTRGHVAHRTTNVLSTIKVVASSAVSVC